MIPALPPLNLSSKSASDGNQGGSLATGNKFSGSMSINTGSGTSDLAVDAKSKTWLYVAAGLAAVWYFKR